MTFEKWYNAFLEEKNLPCVSWELTDNNGTFHMIDSDVVIGHIRIAHPSEQAQIKDVIVKIDFANGDVNHFFKHLAGAIINR